MKKILLIVSLGAMLLTACSKTETTTNSTNSAGNNATNTGTAQATPTIDPNTPVTFPFKDFPAVDTTAKEGEVVLVPSYEWLQEATVKGGENVTMIWYSQKMSKPDKEMSEVEFLMGKKHQVPNAYIVPIPAGQKAKKGDIVLTWWQSGSGMQRAIVMDDATPTEPVVRYLDIDYTSSVTGKDGKTPLGQSEEKLKPNSFVKINAPMEPGTAVAIQDGSDLKHAIVIRAAGEKVYVKGFAGKPAVVDKSRCTPIPITSAAKVGDKVKALWVGGFKDGTVTKVDPKIGRVFVKFENVNDEKAVAFGDVMK